MKCGHFKSEDPLDPETVAQLDDPNLFQPFYNHSPTPDSDSDSSLSPPIPPDVSVDPQWLESVSGACEGEELDALLAQNMFYENLRGMGGRNTSRHGHMEPRHTQGEL